MADEQVYEPELYMGPVSTPIPYGFGCAVTDLFLMLSMAFLIAPDLRVGFFEIGYEEGLPRLTEVFGLLAAVWVFLHAGSRRRGRLNAVHWTLLFLLLVSIAGVLIDENKSNAFGIWRSGYLIPLFLFVMLSQVAMSERRLNVLCGAFIITQAASALVIIAQSYGLLEAGAYAHHEETRMFGFGYNTAQTAFGFCLAIIWMTGVSFGRRTRLKYVWMIVVLICLWGIVLTGTRTAIIALALSMFVMFASSLRMVLAGVGVVGVLAGLFAGLAVIAPELTDRLSQISVGNRMASWLDGVHIAMNCPLGAGFSSWDNPAVNGGINPISHPQNDLIYVWVACGWLGLMAMGAAFVAITRSAFGKASDIAASGVMSGRAAKGLVIAWLIFGTTEMCFSVYSFNGPFFILLALIIARGATIREEETVAGMDFPVTEHVYA